MNWRWYITGLIVALAFFGMSREQFAIPNQEIVVQFNTNSISAVETERAISEITSQLKTIGVEDIQVSEMLDGKLKVTYYSAIDVAVIKNLFSHQKELQFGDTAFNEKDHSSKIPFSNTSNTYKLDVVKIQKDFGSDLGLQGLPAEIKSIKEQYLNPVVSLGTSEINFSLKHCIERMACETYHSAVLLIDNSSHKIPEVRAGPLS